MIRSIYEPFNRGDWDVVFSDAHPDFEITTQRGPTAGTYRGRRAVEEAIEDMLAPFEVWAMGPEEFFDGGDHVVVFVGLRSRPKGSSAEIEIRLGHLWTIREA